MLSKGTGCDAGLAQNWVPVCNVEDEGFNPHGLQRHCRSFRCYRFFFFSKKVCRLAAGGHNEWSSDTVMD